MLRTLFKKPSVIGLSIHPESIQLIEFKENTMQIAVQTHITLPFSNASPAENHLLATTQVTTAIQTIINTAKPSAQYVAVHVPHYLLKEDSITVPINLKKGEIIREIEARIQATYPALKESIHYDYMKETDIRKKQERIHFVLARKIYIEQLVQAVQATGLTVKIIDTEQHALMRTWRYLLSQSHDINTLQGLLSLSPKRVLLLLFKDTQLIFTEEAEWHHDLKQLNQFLTFITNTRMQAHFHLLLTGHADSIHYVLKNKESFPCMTFHTFPLLNAVTDTPLVSIEQSEFYIAFGLAMRTL